jgi:hypothetical protein
MEDLCGIMVTKNTGQHYTERARAAKMQISADGAMIPLRHGIWAEVMTLVIAKWNLRSMHVESRWSIPKNYRIFLRK